MTNVKMWAVMTEDVVAGCQIYTFEAAAKKVRDNYNAIVKQDGMKWRYRVVPVTVTLPDAPKGKKP